MNKLINELGQKAEDYADDTDLPWLATYTEKLAELIVRECAEIARLNTRVDSKVYLMIQEHFGVE